MKEFIAGGMIATLITAGIFFAFLKVANAPEPQTKICDISDYEAHSIYTLNGERFSLDTIIESPVTYPLRTIRTVQFNFSNI